MSYYVYILRSEKTGTYYVGQTENLELRVARHNRGVVNATKSRRPWVLVYLERFECRSDAVKRERQVKGWKSREAIERLICKSD